MPAKTRSARIADIEAAIADLIPAFEAAKKIEASDADEATKLAAWESVEMPGATIHRQSRPLAGKSRGG